MKPHRWLLIIALAAASCSAQIIVNGSFEAPVLTSTQNYFGSFSFTGWSGASTGGTGNAGLVVGTDFGLTPFDGNQHFGFNGNNPAPGTLIEQTFATTIGQAYSVAFAIGRNNGFFNQALGLKAEIFGAGNGILSTLAASPPDSVGYAMATFSFVANSGATTLRFTDISGSNPNTDLFIDSVSVTAVPEPSTFALLLVAPAVMIASRKFERGFGSKR